MQAIRMRTKAINRSGGGQQTLVVDHNKKRPTRSTAAVRMPSTSGTGSNGGGCSEINSIN